MSTSEERKKELEHEKEKETKLKNSIQFMNLSIFLRKVGIKPPLRNEIGVYDSGLLVGWIRYKKAKIQVMFTYDENGVISDLLLNLDDVYTQYCEDKCDGFYHFINRLNSTPRKFIVKEDYLISKEIGEMTCVITSTEHNPNVKFADYVYWGAALYDLIALLNEITGENVKNYTSDEIIDICAKRNTLTSIKMFIIPAFLALCGSIALIVSGILGTIHPAVGWIFGIIILLAVCFWGGVGIQLIREAKMLKNNTLHIKSPDGNVNSLPKNLKEE